MGRSSLTHTKVFLCLNRIPGLVNRDPVTQKNAWWSSNPFSFQDDTKPVKSPEPVKFRSLISTPGDEQKMPSNTEDYLEFLTTFKMCMLYPSLSHNGLNQEAEEEDVAFFFDTVSWCSPPWAGLVRSGWVAVLPHGWLIFIEGVPHSPDPTLPHQIVWSRKAARCLINTIRAVLPHDNHVTVRFIINKCCRC